MYKVTEEECVNIMASAFVIVVRKFVFLICNLRIE